MEELIEVVLDLIAPIVGDLLASLPTVGQLPGPSSRL